MGGGKGKKKNSAWVGKYRFLVKSWTDGVKSEFFVVDLKKEMIVTKHPEGVWSGDDFESTAVLHKGTLSVLNIGVSNFTNSRSSKCYNPINVVKTPRIPEQQDYIHSSDSDTCISTLDLTKTPPIWSNWTPGPKMIFKRDSPYCAILDKMIFACRGTRLNSRNLEVYQIGNDKWEETTIIPFGGDLTPRDPAWISLPPISDPNNNRLIVFFDNRNSLYAYYPPPKNYWELLHQPLLSGGYFFRASAIANQVVGDNLILCFYPDERIFLAYNIFTNKWLDVDWLFKFDDTQQRYLLYGTELVHLGNDILCLVTSKVDYHIRFLRFSVKLVQEQQLVQLTPLSFHSISVPKILCITDTFIPF